nr:hypothetical protein [Brucella pseudintermedia]
MFPYLDTVARRYPPVIVWALLGVNVLAFLYQISLPQRLLDRFRCCHVNWATVACLTVWA